MEKISIKKNAQHYVELLNKGEEKGLSYFYTHYSRKIFFRVYNAVKDDCDADSIVQEVLFKLWLFRENIENIEHALTFIERQATEAITHYYNLTKTRFNRSLLQLDGIEDYQRFMLGYWDDDQEEDLEYLDLVDEQNKANLKKVYDILPSLCKKQQLFINLCLKYSFNYERIAWHLGGISEYTVAHQIEQIINKLQILLKKVENLDSPKLTGKIVLSGGLSEEQQQVLSIRHELGLTFEEIAERLSRTPAEVKKLFLEAHLTVGNKTG